MVSKFNAKIWFCGKERTFKRCPNKTLKNYQKKVEAYQDKLYPLAESTRDYQITMTELNNEIDVINDNIVLLSKLSNPTDDEIRDIMKLNKKKIAIQKKISKLRVDNDEASLANRDKYEEISKDIEATYDEFASKVFKDWNDGEFMEEADGCDYDVAPHLHELYRLSLAGCNQQEIDDAVKKLLTDSFQ